MRNMEFRDKKMRLGQMYEGHRSGVCCGRMSWCRMKKIKRKNSGQVYCHGIFLAVWRIEVTGLRIREIAGYPLGLNRFRAEATVPDI